MKPAAPPAARVSRRRVARATVVVAAALLACTQSPFAESPKTSMLQFDPNVPLATLTRTASEVTLTTPEPGNDAIPNSGRGEYAWMDAPTRTGSGTAHDIYWRDELQWGRDIERDRGVYDFSTFEKGLTLAERSRTKFMFRVMSYCPGCGGNLTPEYVPRQPNGMPDWNSEEFLSSWHNLMRALGERYGNDPRLGFVDIGGYGFWGEWFLPPDQENGTPITRENAERVIRAVTDSFPHKYALINYLDDFPDLAVTVSPRVGLRIDCVGGDHDFELTHARTPLLRDVWRRAPVVGEWCPDPKTTAERGLAQVHEAHLSMLSSGNFPRAFGDLGETERRDYMQAYSNTGFKYHVKSVSLAESSSAGGRLSIATTWSNQGVAPTYDSWSVSVRLRDAMGTLVWESTVPLDLRLLTGDGQTMSSDGVIADIDPGVTYSVSVLVQDDTGYLPPMHLSNGQRQVNGEYAIGFLSAPTG